MKASALSVLLAFGSLLVAPAALAESDPSDAPVTEDLGAAENAPPDPDEAAAPGSEATTEVGNHADADGAYEPTQPFDKAERDRQPLKFGHGGQFGVRAAASFGYKVNFRADNSPPCADGSVPEKKVCPLGAPPAIDLALSYGVLDALELFVWGRLGLGPETVTRTAPSRVLGAGLRIYTAPEDRFKIFLEPAAGVELAGSLDSGTTRNYSPDILAHVNIGGQFDFARYFGLYLSVGPEAAFVRGISLILGGSIGVQGRFP